MKIKIKEATAVLIGQLEPWLEIQMPTAENGMVELDIDDNQENILRSFDTPPPLNDAGEPYDCSLADDWDDDWDVMILNMLEAQKERLLN